MQGGREGGRERERGSERERREGGRGREGDDNLLISRSVSDWVDTRKSSFPDMISFSFSTFWFYKFRFD